MLLEQKADVNARDKESQTGLHIASAIGHAGIVRLLLAAGADWKLQDRSGRTPLMQAEGSAGNGAAEVVRLLKAAAAGESPSAAPSAIGAGAASDGSSADASAELASPRAADSS